MRDCFDTLCLRGGSPVKREQQAKVEIGKAQLADRRAREDAATRSLARKVRVLEVVFAT